MGSDRPGGLVRLLQELLGRMAGLQSTDPTAIRRERHAQGIPLSRDVGEIEIPEGLEVEWSDTLCRRASEAARRAPANGFHPAFILVRTLRDMLKPLLIALGVLALGASACGGADDNASDDAAVQTTAAPVDSADTGSGDESDADAMESGEEWDSGATSNGDEPTGRFEIEGQRYELVLGDSPMAMCTVVDEFLVEDRDDDSATIAYMEADDGSRMDFLLSGSISSQIIVATWRDAAGNRVWVSGNADEAEGLDPEVDVSGTTVTLDGTWVDPDELSNTAEGSLEITC